MSLITPQSQLSKDLADFDADVLSIGEAFNHAAAIMRNRHARFWSMPKERILAVLNHDVPLSIARFEANTIRGAQINATLDELALPQFSNRVPVARGNPFIEFDGAMFVDTTPAEDEPTPPE